MARSNVKHAASSRPKTARTPKRKAEENTNGEQSSSMPRQTWRSALCASTRSDACKTVEIKPIMATRPTEDGDHGTRYEGAAMLHSHLATASSHPPELETTAERAKLDQTCSAAPARRIGR